MDQSAFILRATALLLMLACVTCSREFTIERQDVGVGETFSMSCTHSEGDHQETIHWWKLIKSTADRLEVNTGHHTSELEITSAELSDAGAYYCGNYKKIEVTVLEPERPKTQCERERDRSGGDSSLIGARCDAKGEYTPQQCRASTGECWCVDSQGQEIEGTKTPPGTPPKDCAAERAKTQCERERDWILSQIGVSLADGSFIPQCDAKGEYTPQQCVPSIGECWCVDSQGQEKAETRTPLGTPPKDCPAEPERPKTQCESERDGILSLPGAFIPQCDAKGEYTPQQCLPSTGECWCVDSQGQEKAETRTPLGTPPKDCPAAADVVLDKAVADILGGINAIIKMLKTLASEAERPRE